MEGYLLPLAAAFLWAVSAPVVNVGLRRLPQEHRVACIGIGLMSSLAAGTIAMVAANGVAMLQPSSVDSAAVLSGVFTFILGTGLYYLCGHAYGTRTELAAQFANVKPVITVGVGVLLFDESFGVQSLVAGSLIFTGLGVLIIGTIRGRFHWLPLVLGLCLALAWSLGEILAKYSLSSLNAQAFSYQALVWSTILYLVLVGPIALRSVPSRSVSLNWLWPFLLHGMVSFWLAYSFFFASIAQLGLTRTIIVTVFWPGLAVLLGAIAAYFRGAQPASPRFIIAAMLLLMAGSFIQIL